MHFNVKVFINETEVESSDLPNYQIMRSAIDRIINSIIDRAQDDNDKDIDNKAS